MRLLPAHRNYRKFRNHYCILFLLFLLLKSNNNNYNNNKQLKQFTHKRERGDEVESERMRMKANETKMRERKSKNGRES